MRYEVTTAEIHQTLLKFLRAALFLSAKKSDILLCFYRPEEVPTAALCICFFQYSDMIGFLSWWVLGNDCAPLPPL